VFATGPGVVIELLVQPQQGGMLIGTICGVFVILVCIFGRIAEKYKLVKVKKKIH
jgi:hypothetical protein